MSDSSFDDLEDDPDFQEETDDSDDEFNIEADEDERENNEGQEDDDFEQEKNNETANDSQEILTQDLSDCEFNNLCSICLQRNSNAILLPCGHNDLCLVCVNENFKVENQVLVDNICPTCCQMVESVLIIN